MDDLISRAAAIDAIVSATAFPDAEYIKNLCQNPANSEDWLGGVCDAINAVEDVNTVNAVPVVWLNKKRDSETLALFSNIYGHGDKDIVHSIHKVLELWRKEQKEQNG